MIRPIKGLGRFQGEDATAILAEDWSNESTEFFTNEVSGSSTWLVKGPFDRQSLDDYINTTLAYETETEFDTLTEEEKEFIQGQAGAIVSVSGDGFISVTWSEDEEELAEAWDMVGKLYAEE